MGAEDAVPGALGFSLLKSMESWCDWADEHLEELLEARQAYEGHD